MRFGLLRHKVELQSAAIITNNIGEPEKIWATYDLAWAAIAPLRGAEAMLAQQIKASMSHKLIIRYNSQVTPQHRIKFGIRILEINSARNIDEKNRQIELICTEII